MNHEGIVGVEEEGNALLPTQIGNIHLQTEEEQLPTSCMKSPARAFPLAEEACARRGVGAAKSLAGDLQFQQSRAFMVLSADDMPQLLVPPA